MSAVTYLNKFNTPATPNSLASLWISLAIFLNTTDCLFTYIVLANGATEANPVMAALINISVPLFIACKLLLVNALIVFLVLAAKKSVTAQMGMGTVLAVYSCLFCYHAYNLWPAITTALI